MIIAALAKVLARRRTRSTTSCGPKLRQAVQDGSVDGVTGKVAFDQFGDTTTRVLTVYKVEKDADAAWKPQETEEFQ